MKNSEPVLTNPSHHYKVAVKPLYDEKGNRTPLFATFNESTGRAFSEVGQRFPVVQNEDLLNVAESVFRTNGLRDWKRNISVCGGGARFYARYDFKDRVLEVPKLGDKCGLRLEIRNPHDGSGKIVLALAVLRLVCLNGAIRESDTYAIAQSHVGTINVQDIQNKLDTAVFQHSDILAEFAKLSEIHVPQKHGEIVLAGLVRRRIISTRVSAEINEIWRNPKRKEDKARTAFNLYNAATEHLTHEYEAKHFEASGRVNAKVGQVFSAIAHRPEILLGLEADGALELQEASV